MSVLPTSNGMTHAVEAYPSKALEANACREAENREEKSPLELPESEDGPTVTVASERNASLRDEYEDEGPGLL